MSFELDAGVFRALSREEAPLANALADKIKRSGYNHWDEDYPTLEIFELDAAASELFGFFVGNELVSIISASTDKEEFDDVLGVPGVAWPDCERPYMLCRLCVHPDYRRHGIAAHMMRRAAAEAKKRGADSLWLLVAADNPNAVRIYERLGYFRCGRALIYDVDFFCYALGI